MNNRKLTKVLIWGFLFLYLLIAGVSFFHAIEFFGIGNVKWMAVVLSVGFEVGLALSLAAVLLSEDNKKNILPWILMIVLCAVQCCGNVYSTYKYIALSETEYYQYLAKPLLFWMEGVAEDSVQIVVSWIIGAILPIIALFMTDMVATNIKNLNSDNTAPHKEIEEIAKAPAIQESVKQVEPVKNASEPVFDEKKVEIMPAEESVPDDEKTADNEVFQDTAVSEAEVTTEKQGRFKKWAKKFMQSLKSDK